VIVYQPLYRQPTRSYAQLVTDRFVDNNLAFSPTLLGKV